MLILWTPEEITELWSTKCRWLDHIRPISEEWLDDDDDDDKDNARSMANWELSSVPMQGSMMILESLLRYLPSEHPRLTPVVLDQTWIQVSHKTQS